MPWQPMHMAALVLPAAPSPALAWAAAVPVNRAHSAAMTGREITLSFFMVVSGGRVVSGWGGIIEAAPILARSLCCLAADHEIHRNPQLRRHRRPDARRERGPDAQAAPAGQGRAGHRQDHARRGSR